MSRMGLHPFAPISMKKTETTTIFNIGIELNEKATITTYS